MENEIRSVFLSEDKQKRAEVFNKDGVWYVNMILGGQLIESRPMVSDGGVIHSERYAEDAAENWCLGVIND